MSEVSRCSSCTTCWRDCTLLWCHRAQLLIPIRSGSAREHHERNPLWRPTTWKRVFHVVFGLAMAAFVVWVLEIAYSPYVGDNIYLAIFLYVLLTVARVCVRYETFLIVRLLDSECRFKVLQQVADVVFSAVLGDALLTIPGAVVLEVAEFLLTFGAPNFLMFLVSYALDFSIMVGVVLGRVVGPTRY